MNILQILPGIKRIKQINNQYVCLSLSIYYILIYFSIYLYVYIYISYLSFRVAGHLRYGVQGEEPVDGEPGGAEGDQVGARGGRPLHRHQGGLPTQGPQTR